VAKANQNCSIDFMAAKKFGEVSGLAHVAVRAQFIAADYILAKPGCAKDDDGDAAELRTGFHRGQNRQAAAFGQIQVQDHQVGLDCVGVFIAAGEKSQRFYTVLYGVDLATGCVHPQSFAGQAHIAWIVIHDQ
jgi:hypothetical protein